MSQCRTHSSWEACRLQSNSFVGSFDLLAAAVGPVGHTTHGGGSEDTELPVSCRRRRRGFEVLDLLDLELARDQLVDVHRRLVYQHRCVVTRGNGWAKQK